MSAGALLRPARLRPAEEGRSATWLELFFDLVFVVAVGRLAASVIADPTAEGVARYVLLFVPVWWAWMGFTWYATGYDNDDLLFRAGLLAGMLGVAALAVGVRGVADGDTAGFAVPYALMQLVLAALFLRSARDEPATRRYCATYAVGNAAGAALWLAAEAAPTPGRYGIWALAMAVLMTTPPLAGRATRARVYDPEHIAERYGLFTIIVLGEAIVAVTVGLDVIGLEPATGATAVVGFLLAVAVWWLYFGSVRSSSLSHAGGTRLTGFAWGYGHLLVFGGIALGAVGVELAIEAAHDHHGISGVGRACLAGGLGAYVLAVAAIHAVTVRGIDGVVAWRIACAGAVAVAAASAAGLPAPLGLAVVGAPVVALVIGEGTAGRRRAAPAPA
jgi:low temperature requirement protein LtrA